MGTALIRIATSVSKNDMRTLLLLRTRNVHFCFGGDIYQEDNGIVIGSPLEPVLKSLKEKLLSHC